MADGTKIEWTQATWNILNGCTVLTPGCKHCYAMKLAGTRLQHHPSRAGLTVDTKAGPVWNGQVRLYEPWLSQPLEWTRPREIFVAAHGDLFHDAVSWQMLDKVFAVITLCAVEGIDHKFQILTKRSANMLRYLEQLPERWRAIAEEAVHPYKRPMETGSAIAYLLEKGPLPNVWAGVSVENQLTANQRIPDLLRTPAGVRWISAEPLLGPLDLAQQQDGLPHNAWLTWLDGLDWVVVGGESGTNARPMHPRWARDLRDQCAAAGVPFHFKQHGNWIEVDGPVVNGDRIVLDEGETSIVTQGVRMRRVTKKQAGRRLDGVFHDGVPA